MARTSSILALPFLAAALLHAEVPSSVLFQGYLTNNGTPLNGQQTLLVKACDALVDGNCKTVFNDKVQATSGYYSALLQGMPTMDKPYWLEVASNGSLLPDRIALTATPYALRATVSDSAAKTSFADSATGAERAVTAINAINATHATSASALDNGVVVANAANANEAAHAVNADKAALAAKATLADKATEADHATNSDKAALADVAASANAIANGIAVNSLNGLRNTVSVEGIGGTTVSSDAVANKITISSPVPALNVVGDKATLTTHTLATPADGTKGRLETRYATGGGSTYAILELDPLGGELSLSVGGSGGSSGADGGVTFTINEATFTDPIVTPGVNTEGITVNNGDLVLTGTRTAPTGNCQAGSLLWTDNKIYVCISTGTWKYAVLN